MLTNVALEARGYTILQIEAHRAKRDRDERKMRAASPLQLVAPLLPPPAAREPVVAIVEPELIAAPGPDAFIEPLRVRIDVIQSIVAREFNLTRSELISQQRFHRLMVPRQIACYLCARLSGHSLPNIGLRFGPRDHTTILHARNKIEQSIARDNKMATVVFDLAAKCQDHARRELEARSAAIVDGMKAAHFG